MEVEVAEAGASAFALLMGGGTRTICGVNVHMLKQNSGPASSYLLSLRFGCL